jgi:hypothetical protein
MSDEHQGWVRLGSASAFEDGKVNNDNVLNLSFSGDE